MINFQKEDYIPIKVTRVVAAKPWQVMRRVLRINDYSSYMPNVKESRVFERQGWKFKTKWAVEIDGIPISWIEQETVDLAHATIYFRALEGDFSSFDGKWIFKPHPRGTEVRIEAYLHIGIPLAADSLGTLFEEKVRKNFTMMLEAIHNKIVSERYLSFKKGKSTSVNGFAIIGHPYNLSNLVRYLQYLNPGFKAPSEKFLSKFYELIPAYAMYDIERFRSAAGVETRGLIVVSTFIPDMLAVDLEMVFRKVVEACRVAESHGIGIAALGGFTSIAGEKFGHDLQKQVHIPLTTGNTFTVALALDGVRKAAHVMGIDLSRATVCVIGGTGDIGGGCARILSEEVHKIIVTGRIAAKVQEAVEILKKNKAAKAVIEGATDNGAAVKSADIVIAAASATNSILDMSVFKPGSVICDLAYPKNISHGTCQREDILIFSGGLAEIPNPVHVGFEIGLPSPTTLYGCFSEAILLDLDKRYESFSYGRGNITREKVGQIKAIADRHGFRVAPFYWGEHMVTEERMEQIRRAAERRTQQG